MFSNDERSESHEFARALASNEQTNMWIKTHHNHLKAQFSAKCAELKTSLDNPQQCIGFLNLVRDVEYLYVRVSAYEDAVNDFNNMMKEVK